MTFKLLVIHFVEGGHGNASWLQFSGLRTATRGEPTPALADALLFYCAVARLRTRPVRVRESEGCVTLWWSRCARAVFRNTSLLELVAGGELIDHLTVQESVPARRAA